MGTITIIMYHYIRDVQSSLFPRINALSVSDFKNQLNYLEKNYTFVSIADLQASILDKKSSLPPNSVLLTFDDGYSDHFETVYPILCDRGIKGIFFPPARPIIENSVLDVNKIQFIIAVCKD